METPAGMETGEYKINNGPWYWREANFFRAFKEAGFEPQVIFDVGSSDSGWSYDISSVFPKAQFHLFEPLLDHRPFYRENTANILLARPDFRIHKVAVGDVDGTIKIGSDETGYAASTLLNQANVTLTERIEVPIRRLDTMVFELGLPRPDVLKLDVQGAELAILTGSGSLLDHVQLIQAEVWLMRKYGEETPLLHEVNEYLRSKGFFLVALGDFYYGDYHELFAADAFFARTDLLSRCAVQLPKSSLTEKPVVARVDGAGEKP